MDNIIYYLQSAGGISVYWYELTKRILKNNSYVKFIEYNVKSNNIFRNSLNIKKNKIIYEKKLPLRLLRYLPLTIKIDKNTIFHSSYYRITKQKDVINIVTVHDFTYEYFRRGLAKWIHSLQKKIAVKNAAGIICVSKNTKDDALKFYPFLKNKNIKVIYNGVSNDFFHINAEFLNKMDIKDKILRKIIKQKYILYVGSRSKYKNFDIVIDIIKNLDNYNLVIVGGGDLDNTELKKLNKIKKKFFHFNNISNDLLNILYNYAHCLLYPSSYEGFGIPLVEAMKAGCPVVATNRSSIPEVCGKAALLVSKITVNDFIEKIRKLEDKKFRKEIIERGFIKASEFSWDKCYEETMKFYKEIYAKYLHK